MAIPYIPGAWDMLRQSAVPFTNDLLRTVRPEVFGRYDMQQMLKANPMLATQLANVESGQRDAFAQAFGLKNAANSPIANIGSTPQLRALQQEESLMNEALTTDRSGVLQNRTGARTPEQMALQGEQVKQAPLQTQALQQNLQQGELTLEQLQQNINLNKYKLQDAERTAKQIESVFAKYPTLQGINIPTIAQASVRGNAVDPDLMSRIMNDPGAAQLYTAYEKTLRDQMTEGFIRGRISISANTRDANVMLNTINQGAIDADRDVLRAMQDKEDFQKANRMLFVTPDGTMSPKATREIREEWKRLNNNLQIAYENKEQYGAARAKLLKIDFQTRDEGAPEQAADPELQRAMAAIQAAKTETARQRIRQVYKNSTGKDLPQ